MSNPDPAQLIDQVTGRLRDPVSGQSIRSAKLIQKPRIEGGALHFDLVVSAEYDAAARQRVLELLARGLKEAGFTGPIVPHLPEVAEPAPTPKAPHPSSLPGVKTIIAVASGKGGVGKSSVALHVALGLRALGLEVGLLDADIYGPSLPTLLGLHTLPGVDAREHLVPVLSHGLRCMSIGLMLEKGKPVIWRGPMVMSVVRQFLQEVTWSPLDVLVIDLPPGTGDAQLTLTQTVHLDGAIIVSTPQELALVDAERGLAMFRQLDVPILGVVENMAWYELPGGQRDYPFGQGGAARLAQAAGVDLLGALPLDGRLRACGDAGRPEDLVGPTVDAFREIARKVAQKTGLVK